MNTYNKWKREKEKKGENKITINIKFLQSFVKSKILNKLKYIEYNFFIQTACRIVSSAKTLTKHVICNMKSTNNAIPA